MEEVYCEAVTCCLLTEHVFPSPVTIVSHVQPPHVGDKMQHGIIYINVISYTKMKHQVCLHTAVAITYLYY